MAVMRSSDMVVVCLIVPLMRRMSSANLKLERFASRSCSTSLSLWFVSIGFLCQRFDDVSQE